MDYAEVEPTNSPERASQELKGLSNKMLFTRTLIRWTVRNADVDTVVITALLVVVIRGIAIVTIEMVIIVRSIMK